MTADPAAPRSISNGLTVSQVARDSGVAPSAIRFYEQHGLISSVRTSGNQRRFGDDAACHVKVARVAQRIGLSVAETAAVLATLPPDPKLEDWQRAHTLLVDEAERRIADLRAQLEAITSGEKLCELY